MNDLVARTIIKNKYWVVEQSGKKVATIQAVENGGFVYVQNNNREQYPSVKTLGKKYNIQFTPNSNKAKPEQIKEVYGFPAEGRIYNAMFDVKHQMALYTKMPKSRSHYCAGWYLVNTNSKWVKTFCPKTIVISRYPCHGPFKTQEQAIEKLNNIKKDVL